jgi:hypothetical protein
MPDLKLKPLPKGYWLENGLARSKMPRPPGLIECQVIADIGPGVRPMRWYEASTHICVEPYAPYRELLEAAGYTNLVNMTGLDYLNDCEPVEAIYIIDCIEHMHKNEGLEVIELMLKKATKQIVLYTPTGFMQQDRDNWGLGGHYWQTHRSGWFPGEFPGWHCSWNAKGFFAVKTL